MGRDKGQQRSGTGHSSLSMGFCVLEWFWLCRGDTAGGGGASSPQRFMERHRAALNAYLANSPKLLEGAFAFLLSTPRLIDFANKVAYFRAKVTELKGRERTPPISIAIHRSRAFEESFRQLKPKPAAEMRGPLQVLSRLTSMGFRFPCPSTPSVPRRVPPQHACCL